MAVQTTEQRVGTVNDPLMPPRWKTAIVVWAAIYPSITVVLWLAGPKIASWPLALRTLVITAAVVPLMVFVLLPSLQRLLARWLRPRDERGGAA